MNSPSPLTFVVLLVSTITLLLGSAVLSVPYQINYYSDYNCYNILLSLTGSPNTNCTPIQSCTTITTSTGVRYYTVSCPPTIPTALPSAGLGNRIVYSDLNCTTPYGSAYFPLNTCTQDMVYTVGAIITPTSYTRYSNYSCTLPTYQQNFTSGQCTNDGYNGYVFNINTQPTTLNYTQYTLYTDSSCSIPAGTQYYRYSTPSCLQVYGCVKVPNTNFYAIITSCLASIPPTPAGNVGFVFYQGSNCDQLTGALYHPMYTCIPDDSNSGSMFITEQSVSSYSDSKCTTQVSETFFASKIGQCSPNGYMASAQYTMNNANTMVLTSRFTDSSCTNADYSVVTYNQSCTPNPYCTPFTNGYGSTSYQYVTCPSSMPLVQTGQALVLNYKNSTCTQNVYGGNLYAPLGKCLSNIYPTLVFGSTSYVSYSDRNCTQPTLTYNFTSGVCQPASGGGGYYATIQASGQPLVAYYIVYTTFTDSACSIPANVRIYKQSSSCITSGQCVQIPGTVLFGVISCASGLPNPNSVQVLRTSFTGSTCSLQNLDQAHLYTFNACSANPLLANSYVLASSCGTISYYSDSSCKLLTSNLPFTSGNCMPNGGNVISLTCQTTTPGTSTKKAQSSTKRNSGSKLSCNLILLLILSVVAFLLY